VKLAIVTLLLFLGALGATADDTVTMFEATSPYPIAEVGLALCPTTQACAENLADAVAEFYLLPPTGGGEVSIDTSSPAFGPIAGYLSMTNQQIIQNAPDEAIVPFFWNAGPNPGTPNFFTASDPNINYYEGHFDQDPCVLDGVTQTCGYPIAGSEIEALSISVSPEGEMEWQAEGPNIVAVPEPPTLLELLCYLSVIVAWIAWRFAGCRTMADHIGRARELRMEREGRIRRKEDSQPATSKA
jgi:hypothetical protein